MANMFAISTNDINIVFTGLFPPPQDGPHLRFLCYIYVFVLLSICVDETVAVFCRSVQRATIWQDRKEGARAQHTEGGRDKK